MAKSKILLRKTKLAFQTVDYPMLMLEEDGVYHYPLHPKQVLAIWDWRLGLPTLYAWMTAQEMENVTQVKKMCLTSNIETQFPCDIKKQYSRQYFHNTYIFLKGTAYAKKDSLEAIALLRYVQGTIIHRPERLYQEPLHLQTMVCVILEQNLAEISLY